MRPQDIGLLATLGVQQIGVVRRPRVGIRDLTASVFQSFDGAELLVHGVAVAPGRPFIWVRTPQGHLLGLPGQVTQDGDVWAAAPMFGASGLLRTLRQADGLVRVPVNAEGVEAGTMVEVLLFP